MKRVICNTCGTTYDRDQGVCPVCGRADADELPEKRVSRSGRSERRGGSKPAAKGGSRVAERPAGKKKGGARLAPGSERMPRWLIALIIVVLALAVAVAILCVVASMGIFTRADLDENLEHRAEQQQEQEEENDVLACTLLKIEEDAYEIHAAGGTVSIPYALEPYDTTDPVIWSSSDREVCTVSNGVATARGEGTATVTVTCGEKSDTCTVTCVFDGKDPDSTDDDTDEPANPTASASDYSLSLTDFTLFQAGETATIRVNGAAGTDAVTWSSENPGVATVDGNGTVTGVASGTTNVTARINGFTYTCVVRCNIAGTSAPATTPAASGSYTLNHTDVTLSSRGESFTLRVYDSADNRISGATFYSSNSAVCSVDGAGTVTAVGNGTATVTASANGQSVSCLVRVTGA